VSEIEKNIPTSQASIYWTKNRKSKKKLSSREVACDASKVAKSFPFPSGVNPFLFVYLKTKEYETTGKKKFMNVLKYIPLPFLKNNNKRLAGGH